MKKSAEVESSDLEPGIDIDLAAQIRILELAARLEHDDHYSLLGVSPHAEKSEIKRAYFDLMNLYHADRFFGKNTGKFAPLLLKITDVLTRANDTLSRNKTRSEYDAYLENRRGTLGARASITPEAPDSTRPSSLPIEFVNSNLTMGGRPAVAPIDVIPHFPKAPKAPIIDLDSLTTVNPDHALEGGAYDTEFNPDSSGNAAHVSSGPVSSERVRSDPPSQPVSSSRATVEPRSDQPQTRRTPAEVNATARRLLAKKMGLRSRSPVPSANTEQMRDAVRADLKARYDARKHELVEKVRKLLAKSEVARSAGDWSSAVAGVKMAAELCPDDPDIQRRLISIQSEADKALAPRFLEQAKYEEREGQYARAARSYERAAIGKDSAALFNKGAECLLHLSILSDVEKRMLVEFSRNAVSRDQHRAQYRVTLARAYDAAGMKTSALGELGRALELEPENQSAKLLQKTLK